jgi:hypothetical protein
MAANLSSYRDQHFKGTRTEQEKLLEKSATLYVGNMSFYTTEEQVNKIFKVFLNCKNESYLFLCPIVSVVRAIW